MTFGRTCDGQGHGAREHSGYLSGLVGLVADGGVDPQEPHPETYPKYQAQLGRVVLLRDMINWCIEHPVRGQPLAADDPKLRALEAYILAQRKGKSLDYGRH